MGRGEAGEEHVRTLSENGSGAHTVTIPVEMVRNLLWQDGQRLVVKQDGETITITDWENAV